MSTTVAVISICLPTGFDAGSCIAAPRPSTPVRSTNPPARIFIGDPPSRRSLSSHFPVPSSQFPDQIISPLGFYRADLVPADPGSQLRGELIGPDRFRQVIVHPGLQTQLSVALHRVGRERQDGDSVA